MRVIRGNQIPTVMALALIVGMVLLASDGSLAQEKKKVSWSVKPENSKSTFRQRFEIPDIPGHAIVMEEYRRTWPNGGAPVVEGRKVVEEIAWGMADGVAGNGLQRGYRVWRFENGDQSSAEWSLAFQSVINPDRSRKVTFVGTYVETGGTGTLKGIKGVGRFSGVTDFNPELKPTRNEYSAEGEYWFEK